MVRAEKASIYENCIPYLTEKYNEEFGQRSWEVIGLWFGARGSVSKNTVDFFDMMRFERGKLAEIANNVISDTVRIM